MVLALILYGSYQVTKLPIDAVPDITNNQVQVITVAPAFSATDIERLVTFPIEQANRNIPGIKEIRSFSRFGLSLVTIVFNDETDVYFARQQVSERLQSVKSLIPKGIGSPELGPVSTGLGEIYQYVVKPKKGYEQKFDATALRTIQDWIVRRQLLGVTGVAEVSSFGGKLKQYEIAINPNKLHAYGITVNDVFSALENNNQNTGGSYIESGGTVLYIHTEGLLANADDIGGISIPLTGRNTLFIRDVATIKIGFATRYGAICYNDQGEVSGAIVMMLKGANSNAVIKNVKERIAQIQKTLPEGVEIEPFLDRTKMVNNSIKTVEKNLLEGALIVVFVLVMFLGNARAGLLVASVIPLAMLFTICMMNAFGVSGNLMSLGALDFGLIVDGAVIIVEAVMHQLAHNNRYKNLLSLNQTHMDETVNRSASKMMNSAVFGQIIILIVYLPIFSLEGIEGKMFKPMAQAVAFALLGAFILSLTYIPMMSAFVLSKKPVTKKNLSDRIMERIEKAYQISLAKVIRFPKMALAVVIALFIGAIFVLTTLGGEFIPTLEEGDFAVDTRVLTGSNLNTTIASTQKAAHLLLNKFPEVEKVVTKIGSGEVPTDPMPMDASDMMVILKDRDQWTSAKTFNELSEKMGKALEDIPGITTGFQYPVQMRFNELMTGARQDVVCKIFGENLDTLALFAGRLAKIISKVKGHQSVYVEPVTGMPQLVVTYNRPMLAQYQLSVADVNKVINTSFAGQSTGLVFEEEKRFELVVRLENDVRQNVNDIQNLLIPTPAGNQVPLNQLATVAIVNGPNQIQREDARRRIVVGFNVKGRDVQSLVKELQLSVDKQIKLPPGYTITYGGAFENLEQGKKRLMVAVPLSLLMIFVLLFFAFNSVRQGLLIYSAIPLSAIGGIYFLALRGMPFSISAGIGFIALFGVAVLNGIVLIAEFNRLKAQGISTLSKIVLTGTRMRLRPVLMTASVASLGFLPMSLSDGAGAEVQRPLATVVIGGLLVATFLTLYILPVLYILFEKKEIARQSIQKVVPMAIILLLFSLQLKAQTFTNLDSALSIAVKNNYTVKSDQLRAAYAKAFTKTGAEIPKAYLYAEAGQLNSIYTDTRFGLTQSFSLPKVYNSQRAVYEQEYSLALTGVAIKEQEVRKAVTQTYYQYLYLKQKEQLLLSADTLFSNFYDRASLRLQKGESNILEKATAANQKTSIKVELLQTQQQLQLTQLQFQLLLNDVVERLPAHAGVTMQAMLLTDSISRQNNPVLAQLLQQREIAAKQTALQKARLLPDITVGYSNMSIQGTGADNKIYGAGKRFHTALVGMAIPIFAKYQKEKVKAFKVSEQVAQSEYDTKRVALQFQYQKVLSQYQSDKEVLLYFEKEGLPNAKLILETGGKQFNSGAINYLEYVTIINQAIGIQRNYVEAFRVLNEVIIEINYLQVK